MDVERLADEIVNCAKARGLTIYTAESCSAGRLALALSKAEGASKYFLGGIVAYTAADGFVRRDTLISFNLQVEQPFGKYLVVGARYAVSAVLTDFVVEYANGFIDPAEFNRHFAMGFVAVRY